MNITIQVTRTDKTKLTLEVPEDSDIYEWEGTLRVILKWLTFDDKTIDDLFVKDDEE